MHSRFFPKIARGVGSGRALQTLSSRHSPGQGDGSCTSRPTPNTFRFIPRRSLPHAQRTERRRITRLVAVPQTLDDDAVDALLAAAADAGDEKLLFDARHVRFADPFGMLGLLALGTYLRETGGRPMLRLPQSPDVLRYLGGMGFLAAAGAAFEVGDAARPRAAGESSVLLPITVIGSHDDVHGVVAC